MSCQQRRRRCVERAEVFRIVGVLAGGEAEFGDQDGLAGGLELSDLREILISGELTHERA